MSGDFLELSGLYLKNEWNNFSNFIQSDSAKSIGKSETIFYEISADYFFKLKKVQSDKLSFYWSPSVS